MLFRSILDRRGRLPLSLRLLAPAEEGEAPGRRLYATTRHVGARRLKLLAGRGIDAVVVGEGPRGLDLEELLDRLARSGISQVLVEGGPALAGSFLDLGLAREVAAYIAPRLLGGKLSRGSLEGRGATGLDFTPWISNPGVHRLGRDFLIEGRIHNSRAQE